MKLLNSKAALLSGATAAVLGFTPALLPAAHAQNDYITLSQYSGMPGSSVQVMGYGFMPNHMVSVSGMSGVLSDGSGNFSVSYTIPSMGAGNTTISAADQSGDSASATYYVNGYYPTAQPSSWYVLPGQSVSFSGSGFWPNEPVNVMMNGGVVATMNADGGGNLNSGMTYMMPWSAANSTQSFTLMGQWSNASVQMNVSVGSYYPQVTPSTYYTPMGSGFTVTGSGYAPNEPVNVTVAGMMMTVTADGGGNFSMGATAPMSSGSFTVMATGQWSNASSQQTVTAY